MSFFKIIFHFVQNTYPYAHFPYQIGNKSTERHTLKAPLCAYGCINYNCPFCFHDTAHRGVRKQSIVHIVEKAIYSGTIILYP